MRCAAGVLPGSRARQRGRSGSGRNGAEELAARPAMGGTTHNFIFREDEDLWQGSRSSPFLATSWLSPLIQSFSSQLNNWSYSICDGIDSSVNFNI
jgi:hypothetical protein